MKRLALRSGIRPFLGVTGLIAGGYLFADRSNISGLYDGIWIMPFVFLLSLLVIAAVRDRHRAVFKITYNIVLVLLYIRLVIMPIVIHFAGPSYTGILYISVSENDIREAIYIISYESLVMAVLFFFAAPLFGTFFRRQEPVGLASPRIVGSRLVYGFFSVAGLVVLLAWGLPKGIVNFLFIREGTVEQEMGALHMLLRQVMVIATWLIFIWAASKSARLYAKGAQRMALTVAVLTGGILLFVIVGDRRSFQIFTGAAVIYVLLICFPTHRRLIFASIAACAAAAFASMTLWRLFLRHGIEVEGMAMASLLDFGVLATALQAYVGGPLQIAIANVALEASNIGPVNLVFDILRSTFIVNFLVRGDGMLSSEIFNDFIYGGEQLTGLIIFSGSYGFTIFGPVLSPVFLCLNLLLAMITEIALRRCQGVEVKFLFVYILMRVVVFIFISTPLILSVYTMQLFTFGLLIFVAHRFRPLDEPFRAGRAPKRHVNDRCTLGSLDRPRRCVFPFISFKGQKP